MRYLPSQGRTSPIRSSRGRLTLLATALAGAASILTGCNSADSSSASDSSSLLVWVDAVRTPGVEAYAKAHPDLEIKTVTIAPTPGELQSKLALAMRAESGIPDVVFLNTPADIAALSSPPLDYAAPLDDLISSDTRAGFAPGALDACTFGDATYCLRNDIGQTVLWYNAPLMKEFGYEVPTTWQAFQELGEKVAKEHPGYVIGNLSGKPGAEIYFDSSGCPTRDVTAPGEVRIDLADEACTRVAELLQPLVDNGTVSTLDQADPAYVKLGNQGKILMMPGPSWAGDFLFKPTYKLPEGELAAASLPTWPDETDAGTSSVGGGMFAISKAAEGQRLDEAYALVEWLTTDVEHQSAEPTYPAFKAAASAWCEAKATDPFYASDPCPVLEAAAGHLRSTQGMISFQPEWVDAFNSTVVDAGRSGGSLVDALGKWESAITAAAENAGYQVTS